MNSRRVSLLGLITLIAFQNALGQGPYDTWTFHGILTAGLPDSPYAPGSPYAADFVLDSARLSPNGAGRYFPTVAYDLFVDGHFGFRASSLAAAVLIANDEPGGDGGSFDGIVFTMFDQTATGFPAGNWFNGLSNGVTLVSTSTEAAASPFTGTIFPSTLDLNQFSQRYMTVHFQDGPVRGTVDSLYINGVLISQVPEPSCLSLFVISISVLLCHRFWRRVQGNKLGANPAYDQSHPRA